MSGLSLVDVHKSFGETRAVVGVSFDARAGEVVAILGPSGCGKSTVLSLIAGLEPPDRGDILWDGVSLAGVPPFRRGFGLMFQDFALFPHRNVFDNVAFGLQMERLPKAQVEERVAETLALVGLAGFGGRDVNTLSGGEQQRVALARSLAPRPRLLMLDEPLGSLDRAMRERLVLDLQAILRRLRQTAIYVTHDQEEAFVLADQVAVMNAGRIEQIGPPQEVYRKPATAFVARFLGLDNLVPGQARRIGGSSQVETPLGTFPLSQPAAGKVTVLIRPDAVRLNGQGSCLLEGIVRQTSFRGSVCRAVIEVRDLPLLFEFPSNLDLPEAGEKVKLAFDPEEAIQVFPE